MLFHILCDDVCKIQSSIDHLIFDKLSGEEIIAVATKIDSNTTKNIVSIRLNKVFIVHPPNIVRLFHLYLMLHTNV